MNLKDITNKLISDNDGALFLTKKEAALALEVSTASIDNYRSIGSLKSIHRGQKVYISVEVIARAMRDGIDATGMKEHLKASA